MGLLADTHGKAIARGVAALAVVELGHPAVTELVTGVGVVGEPVGQSDGLTGLEFHHGPHPVTQWLRAVVDAEEILPESGLGVGGGEAVTINNVFVLVHHHHGERAIVGNLGDADVGEQLRLDGNATGEKI